MIGLRSLPSEILFDPPQSANFSGFNNVAVFRYKGAPDAFPTVAPDVDVPVSKKPLVETDLHVS